MSDFPGVGDAMPDIAMETPDGGTVKPSDFMGRKLVVFFYPKDNTPGCTTEAKDFTALKGEFDKAGVELLGVSKDSPSTSPPMRREAGCPMRSASGPRRRCTGRPSWVWYGQPIWLGPMERSLRSGTR